MKSGISIIGAGRIGRALGRRLRENGWKIHAVVTRSQTTARRALRSIGGGNASVGLGRETLSASVLLIAVPDSAIEDIVNQLAAFGPAELRGKIALHTSGARSSEVMSALRSDGVSIGSIHPLQSFSGIGIPSLDGRIFAVEGDPAAVRVARGIARALGGHIVQLEASEKPLYHAAAVMCAGQLLALEESAIQLFVSLGMKRQEAMKALLPLTRQVLENLERLGPRASWTGPLARGDYRVIGLHENALRSAPPEYLDAYRAMNRLAARVLARDPDAALNELASI